MDERAFSPDGYIIDQGRLKDIKYGVFPASVNGCGWIAAYNALHSLGIEKAPEEVYGGFMEILPYHGGMGTPTATMLKYLRGLGLKAGVIRGKKNILAAADETETGILRYKEVLGDHYVTFMRQDALRFRFFNAEWGEEKHVMPLEIFFEKYVHFPGAKLIRIGTE